MIINPIHRFYVSYKMIVHDPDISSYEHVLGQEYPVLHAFICPTIKFFQSLLIRPNQDLERALPIAR